MHQLLSWRRLTARQTTLEAVVTIRERACLQPGVCMRSALVHFDNLKWW